MQLHKRGPLWLMLLTALLFLSGCQEAENTQTAEPVCLTALQYELESQSIHFADMWFFDELEKQTGVHVDFEEVKDADWKTRLSLMFASSNYKDLILRGSLDTEDYGVTQQLLVPLDSYLEEHMPHYFSRLAMDDISKSIVSSDGNSYYIGFLISQNTNTDGHFFINREWLDQLGLEVPTTIEELTDVLRAFRDGDPNQNGLKDEVPYQANFDDCNTGIYNVFSAWGIPMNAAYVFIDTNDQVRFAPLEPGFREGVEWLHLLYSENLLDRECTTQGSVLWGAKMNRDSAGYFSYWRLGNTTLSPEITEQFECMLPVSAEGHQAQMCRTADAVEFGAALTVQNEHIEDSLRWLDAQMETETMLVAQNGPVGDMLTLREDGRYEVAYVPESNELYQIVPVICGQFYAPASYYETVYVPAEHRQEKVDYCEAYQAAGVLEEKPFSTLIYTMSKTSEESARMSQLYSQLKNVVNYALVDLMANGVTDENYAAFEQMLLDAGAKEYRQLYQTAYDRHLKRMEADDR